MDDIKKHKERIINDYISNIMLSEDSIDVNKIKEELGTALGEKPGIELNYKLQSMVVEDGKKDIKSKKLESIIIYYSYEDMHGNLRFDNSVYLAD